MNYIDDNENHDLSIILPKPPSTNLSQSLNILNTIVQHPYVEDLPHNTDTLTHLMYETDIKILLYRINRLNEHYYVEYYIPNSGLLILPGIKEFTNASNCYKIDDTFIGYLKTYLSQIPGTKRYKGYLTHDKEPYVIVQTRDNHEVDDWVVIWDILANKQIYGVLFDNTLIDFFAKYHNLSELYINDTMCILPSVLYCQVPTTTVEYVRKHKSCQYTQREMTPLIKLHRFSIGDNVRNLCFIKDTDISKTYLDIEMNDYIILDEDNTINYIFKHDTNILSLVKSSM